MQQYTYIHRVFYKTMNEYDKPSSILVAISGGQDSICLIKLLNDFINQYDDQLKIEYIYVDHQWRIDATKNIKHLANYLTKTRNKLAIYQIKQLTNSETKARSFRYQIIIDHAKKYHFSTIITGHTKNDQVETFLQKLIRGTTIDGGTSLNTRRNINHNLILIRPLLTINTIELQWFSRKFFLPAWSDSTNYNYSINRNRLRYELLPYIQKYYQVNLIYKINDFLKKTITDNDYIKQNTVKLYLLICHNNYVAINCKLFIRQHKAIKQRIIQLLLYNNFQKNLDFYFLAKIINISQKIYDKRAIVYIQIPYKNLFINIGHEWIYIS